tara:strand:+ start:2326 stop:2913 length:588 start_codon:yes stop_codon:yes gene_type:complete
MKYFNKALLFLTASFAVAHIAWAASPGEYSQTQSTATLGISLGVNNEVMVSGLQDVTLSQQQIDGLTYIPEGADYNFCVYSTGTLNDYTIQFTSANPQSTTSPGYPFSLSHVGVQRAGAGVVYSLEFHDSLDQSTQFDTVPYNAPLPHIYKGSNSQTCNGGQNAQFRITFKNLDQAILPPAGTYSDTVSVLVKPV